MAEKTASPANPELDSLAFELFKTAVAGSPVKRGGEQQARDAYTKAEAFLSVRDKIRSGAISTAKPEGPQLADCCCPNQKKTHPHNLVSQRMGSLERVNRIAGWLAKNPPSQDRTEDEIADACNQTFSELNLGWTGVEVKTARALFPAYVKAEVAKN